MWLTLTLSKLLSEFLLRDISMQNDLLIYVLYFMYPINKPPTKLRIQTFVLIHGLTIRLNAAIQNQVYLPLNLVALVPSTDANLPMDSLVFRSNCVRDELAKRVSMLYVQQVPDVGLSQQRRTISRIEKKKYERKENHYYREPRFFFFSSSCILHKSLDFIIFFFVIFCSAQSNQHICKTPEYHSHPFVRICGCANRMKKQILDAPKINKANTEKMFTQIKMVKIDSRRRE